MLAETGQPSRLATRTLKPSLITNWWPPFQAAFGPIDHVLVIGSRNWRTLYCPVLMNQSPAGIGSVLPAASV
jgi:hypothetical protein